MRTGLGLFISSLGFRLNLKGSTIRLTVYVGCYKEL